MFIRLGFIFPTGNSGIVVPHLTRPVILFAPPRSFNLRLYVANIV